MGKKKSNKVRKNFSRMGGWKVKNEKKDVNKSKALIKKQKRT